LLNAYTYWLLLNEKEENSKEQSVNARLNRVIEILVDEPEDFVPQMLKLIAA
jgi:hypothetical protein